MPFVFSTTFPSKTSHWLCCGLLMALLLPLQAQTTRTWDGEAGTLVLTDPANWSGNALPASTGTTDVERQDAYWNGLTAGPLNLTFAGSLGGAFGMGLVMGANQTSAVNLSVSTPSSQVLRLINSTSSGLGSIQVAAGAGALSIGSAGSSNPISLLLGQGANALEYHFNNLSANAVTLGENVTLSAGDSHPANLNFNSGAWDIRGKISSIGSIVVNGGAQLALGGINTFSVVTTIFNGSAVVGNNLAFGTGSVTLNPTASGAVARLRADASDRSLGNTLSISGASPGRNYLGAPGTGKLTFTSFVTWGTTSRNLTIDSSTVEFSSTWSGSSATAINSLDGTNVDSSVMILNGDRGTVAKQLQIGDKLTVRVNHANSFGSSNTYPLLMLGGSYNSVIELSNNITLARSVTLQGRSVADVALRNVSGANSIKLVLADGGERYHLQSLAGTLTVSDLSGVTGNRDLQVSGAGSVVVPGWDGRRDILVNGGGSLSIGGGSNSSSITGKATVSSGTLIVNATGAAALAAAGGIFVESGGTLVAQGTGNSIGDSTFLKLDGVFDLRQNESLGALYGSGIVRNSTAQDQTLSVGGDGLSSTFSGLLEQGSTGKLGLTKVGAGTLVLSGNSTNQGATSVSAGVLQVGLGGQGAIGSGALSVSGNATLTGTGTIRTNSLTVANNGIVQAGDGTAEANRGTLSFAPSSGTASFQFQSGSKVILGISTSGPSDQLSFTSAPGGSLIFNGTLQVLATGYLPTKAESFQLLSWSNLSNVSFASRYLPSSYANGWLLGNGDDNLGFDLPDISGSGYAWNISNLALNGMLSTIHVVPEPSRVVLLMLGLLCLLLRRGGRQAT
jgi:autotransporter-associated beta strand protein